MADHEGARIPKAGEALILADGRRFRLASVDHGVRGWWFCAIAEDGASTLQGNLALDWDPERGTWCPAGSAPLRDSATSLPPSMRRGPARHKQLD